MAKSSLNHTERTRLEFLTSHLRGSAPATRKARYENEIAALLEGKELTRSDMALASYYLGNSGSDAESRDASQAFAQAYRAAPAQ